MSTQALFLGIDGGGTKCKARLENANGALLGEGLSGPGNPAHDASLALQSIMDACNQAIRAGGLDTTCFNRIHACLGLAGVNVPAYYKIASDWQLPFATCTLTHDLHIACAGAHNGQDGAIIITGTGSSAFADIAGQQTLLGGHGFPLGDEAGGAWLGWRAISLTLNTLDGLVANNQLTQHICAALKTDRPSDIIGETLHYKPSQFAKLAKVVVDTALSDDSAAQSIMHDGATYISNMIKRLTQVGSNRIAMIGGLAQVWKPWLADRELALISPANNSPEQGAIALARHAAKEL